MTAGSPQVHHVDKSGTSCYHLVTRLMRPTYSQQGVPTSHEKKLVTTCYEQPVLVLLE
jgi:hypothetical protein